MSTGPMGDWSMDQSLYLVFRLGDHQFGLEILAVREIVRATPATPIPNVPPVVRGVMNLRGRIVPVIEMASLLGLPGRGDGPKSCYVVLDGVDLVGLAVDRVNQVLRISTNDIDPAETLATCIRATYVQGIARYDDEVLILLDAEAVIKKALESLNCSPPATSLSGAQGEHP